MCTNFKIMLKDMESGIVVGRSMEFAKDLDSKLYFRKAGHHYTQESDSIPGEVKRDCHLHYQWTGKYGFVGINARGFLLASDGMNTEGLATNGLWLNRTTYPDYHGEKALPIEYFGDWLLSSFATCEEVKEALIRPEPEVVVIKTNLNIEVPAHYSVHDALGNSIVIEFIDGKTMISDNNDVGVLTNDPPFQWHLENLRNYVGITPWNVTPPPICFGDLSVYQMGHGSGFAQLPGGLTPPDRFVRAAMMIHYSYPTKDLDSAAALAWHILNAIDIPLGINRFEDKNGDISGDYTQWAVVADLIRKIYSVRMYDSPLVYSVELEKVDLEKCNGKLVQVVPIDQKKRSISIDITPKDKHFIQP